MLSLGTKARFPAGRCMMRLGEPSGHAFLLIDGLVKVHGNDSGHEPLLAIRAGGDLVGEMGVLSAAGRSASVTTCSATMAHAISAADLRAFLCSQAEVSFALACLLADRLRWANQRRIDFAATDAASRVCRVLVALSDMYGRPAAEGLQLAVPLTQSEIASLAGVGLATVEKTLRALARDKILHRGYRRIVVSDPEELWRRADTGNS
ncbi:Crp/Fnr family transcriptional regulator [Rhizocola hellebori]|nr:Crp/Fnr family transcriptional regulator [Rhizocola hellebori]